MREPTQRLPRVKDRNKSPHVLALRTLYTPYLTTTKSWNPFLSTIMYIRKKSFSWTFETTSGPNSGVYDWVRKTPLLNNWARSEACLRSPTAWPREIYPAFKYRLIPTPHDIANVDMSSRYARNDRQMCAFLMVLLYCMGLTVPQIAEGYRLPESSILRTMYLGIEGLQDIPEYILWASGTDFRRCVYPPFLTDVPMRKRMRFLAALQSNPFYADADLAKRLTGSPPYLSYLIYGSPKRMRLTKGCRLYRTEEPHVTKKQIEQ